LRPAGLLALVLALPLAAGAPPVPPGRYLFRTYGPEQGLSDLGLTSIAQDRDGFIWIGCDSGLVRYDGTAFTRWSSREGLPSSTVRKVLPRRSGGVWAVAEGGISGSDKGRFFLLEADGRPFLPSRAAAVDVDGDGVLWALGTAGLYRIEGRAMVRVDALPRGRGRTLACGTGGELFVEVEGEVWRRAPGGGWARVPAGAGPRPDVVEALGVDGTGRLWVVGRQTLHFQEAGGPLRDASPRLPAPAFSNASIHRDRDGALSIPTNAGILRVKGDAFEQVGTGEGLPFRWTAASLLDREGNLWVVGPALCRQLGRGWTRAYTLQDGLPSDLVWVEFRDRQGRLYAGTSEGLARLGPKGWERVKGTEGHNVGSLDEDASGRLYIGSTNGPLLTLEPGASAAGPAFLRSLRPLGCTLPGRSLRLLMGPEGLWMSDPALGILLVDPARRTVRVAYGPQDAGVSELSVYQFEQDAQGRVWCATSAGLLVKDGPAWHRFGRAEGLKSDALNGIVLDGKGGAWLLYREVLGLQRAEFLDGRIRMKESLDSRNGLGTDAVYAAAMDAQGTLWMGTDRGVEGRLTSGAVFHLGRGGGLVADDCSQGGIYVDANQDVWVGTSMGLSRILADRRPAPLGPVPVTITHAARGRGADCLRDPRPIPSREATLEFRFAAQTYINEKAVIYQVRLVGLEEEWRTIAVAQDRYAALPAGEYRFEVRAAYPGMPYGPVASYPFRVLPPWWTTWWFVTGAGLGAAGLAAWAMDRRFKALGQQKERLAAMVDKATADLVKANHALEEANLALQAQSLSDPLTGLHNRRFLTVVVEDDLAKVQRAYHAAAARPAANADLVFFLVDLDHFKEVNDRHGHHAGDLVLERVAKALRRAARDTDAVVRWGGEEFLLMARNASRAEAPAMAERIRAAVAEAEVELETGQTLRWTCSVGFAAYPFSPGDPAWMGWERVVEIADGCLYMAKRGGRDAWAGAVALPGLDRAAHGPRIPWELAELASEGVVRLEASRPGVIPQGGRVGD